MKFELDVKTLSEALSTVGRAIPAKPVVNPVLANVLVSAQENGLELVGTDLEVSIIAKVKAKVEVPGKCTIPAKLFIDVVTSLPFESETELVLFNQVDGQENIIQLSTGRGKYNLQVQGTEPFPPMPLLEGEKFPQFTLPTSTLKLHLRQVSIAMGVEETNPTQRSVCLNFHGGDLRLMSTDSKRLALVRLPGVSYPTEFERNFLIPHRGIPEIMRILEDGEVVNIGLFKEQLVFSTPSFTLFTRLYDGKYPDYQRVIPKESIRHLTISNKEFSQALKAVFPIARLRSMMVRLDAGQNETRIWAESPDCGTSEVFVTSNLEGEPIQIAFNGKYILDFLAVCESEKILLEMTTPKYPGVLKPISPEPQYLYVIMPMTY
ncbi:DNA polymerase III subunit beta [bacterium]|nr:DNA polymerase III subunit beta [bacterium]